MYVHLVWHIRHHAAVHGDAAEVEHERDGELNWDETLGDDVKLLGVFSSRAGADARIDQARLEPGFRDEPDCFIVDRYEVDRPTWTDGFGWVDDQVLQRNS